VSRAKVHVPADYQQLSRQRLVRLVGQMVQVIDALEKQNQELQREAKRQTGRFSKGKKPGKHKKPGRKAGQGQFTHRLPPEPEEITETQTVEAPQVCPQCGESDIEIGWEDAFITELPEPRPTVKHYRRPVCSCRGCKHHWRAPHPDLADDQFGATAHRLGPRLRSAAHVLHYQIGVPVRKVPQVLEELHRVSVTQSALTQDALRTASAGPVRERFEQIKDSVAQAPVVHADSTSWRKAGKSAALIVFATPDTPEAAGKTVYLVRDHHGADEILEVLGKDFKGILHSDRGPEFDSKKLDGVRKQKCNSHIKHNIREVLETKVGSGVRRFCIGLRRLLDQARQLRRDYDAGLRDGYAEKVAKLEADLTHYLRSRTLSDPDNRRMLEQIGRQHAAGNVLRFLHDPRLSPDNHLAEREIRPAVIARKVSHCSKNDAGADSHGVHSTVYRTENRAERRQKTGRGIIGRVVHLFKSRRARADASESGKSAPTPTAPTAPPTPTARTAPPTPTAPAASTAPLAPPTPTAPAASTAPVAPTATENRTERRQKKGPGIIGSVRDLFRPRRARSDTSESGKAAPTHPAPSTRSPSEMPPAAPSTAPPRVSSSPPSRALSARPACSSPPAWSPAPAPASAPASPGAPSHASPTVPLPRASSAAPASGSPGASPRAWSSAPASPGKPSLVSPATPVPASRDASPRASSCAPLQRSPDAPSRAPASSSPGAPLRGSSVAPAPASSRAPPRHRPVAP